MQGLDLDRATPDQRKVAGVCAAIADRWHIDPLLVRVAAVILALFSGVGAVLYGAAWALLPVRGEADGPLMRKLPAAQKVPLFAWILVVAALCIAAMATLGPVSPISTGPVIGIALVWYFAFYRPAKRRGQHEQQPGPPESSPPAPAGGSTAQFHAYPAAPGPDQGAGAEPVGYADQLPPVVPAAAQQGRPGPPSSHQAPRRTVGAQPSPTSTTGRGHARSRTTPEARRVRRIALAVAAGAMVVLALLNLADVAQIPLVGYTATALLIVGGALVVAAWYGKARGLVPLGCALLVATLAALAFTAHPGNRPFAGTAGDTMHSYTTVQELPDSATYDTGQHVVDLSGLAVDRSARYAISVDAGTIELTLPADANVVVRARSDLGSVTLPGRSAGGVDLDLSHRFNHGEPGGPVLHLDLRVDIGTVTVVAS